jgi:hypothetical protein
LLSSDIKVSKNDLKSLRVASKTKDYLSLEEKEPGDTLLKVWTR